MLLLTSLYKNHICKMTAKCIIHFCTFFVNFKLFKYYKKISFSFLFRFTRELQKLKKMADYTSRDTANINNFLQGLSGELCIYTYNFLNAGIEKKENLRNISEDQLLHECGIENSIHRYRIMEGIRMLESGLASDFNEDNLNKSLDVFVSYRRSNGSQLASLLKVHLQLRGFSVFIDVERLEAGKFDNNLLQSIQKARHFLLVLTPNALDRCVGDGEQKDWVHRVSIIYTFIPST